MNPKSALTLAVRRVLIDDALIASEGVYQHVAPREDDLPYTVFMFRPRKPMKGLETEVREYQLVVKVCAALRGGLEAEAVAEPIKSAIYERLTQVVGGVSAQERLNVYLNPLGWTALVPLEVGDVEEFFDTVGANKDVRRYHFGNLYSLRVVKL